MEAPKCPLCEKRHYGQCDIKPGDVPPVIDRALRKATRSSGKLIESDELIQLRKENVELRDELDSLKSAQDTRKKYHRDYMRRKRECITS